VKGFRTLVLIVAFAGTCLATITSDAATLRGQQVQGGKMIEIQFPIDKYYQDIAMRDGNPRPEVGTAVLSFPPGFDPARRWPILVVTSTSDYHRVSTMDVQWYRPAADAEGWVLIGTDATIKPQHDSTPWRLAMLAAGLETMRKEWPQSAHWPIAFGGFSGGSKRSGLLGAMLAKTGAFNICGFFLAGIGEDRLSPAYKIYQPRADFLNIPIWISGGMDDIIATPSLEGAVVASLRRTGFKRVRVEHFVGSHQLKRSEVRLALRWFRELGGF
jgi:hypothetical protein